MGKFEKKMLKENVMLCCFLQEFSLHFFQDQKHRKIFEIQSSALGTWFSKLSQEPTRWLQLLGKSVTA